MFLYKYIIKIQTHDQHNMADGWRESSDSLLTFDSVVFIELSCLHTAVWP